MVGRRENLLSLTQQLRLRLRGIVNRKNSTPRTGNPHSNPNPDPYSNHIPNLTLNTTLIVNSSRVGEDMYSRNLDSEQVTSLSLIYPSPHLSISHISIFYLSRWTPTSCRLCFGPLMWTSLQMKSCTSPAVSALVATRNAQNKDGIVREPRRKGGIVQRIKQSYNHMM